MPPLSISQSQISTWHWNWVLNLFTYMIFLLSVISNIISFAIIFYYPFFFEKKKGNIAAVFYMLVILPMHFLLLVTCFIEKDFMLNYSNIFIGKFIVDFLLRRNFHFNDIIFMCH